MRNDYIISLENELDSLLDEKSEFRYVGKDRIKVLVDKNAPHSVKGLKIRMSKASKRYLQVEQCISVDGKMVTTSFGRNILGLKKGDSSRVCDHKNRNPLDNRRVNLREGTKSENSRNRLDDNKSSNYKHVYRYPSGHFRIDFAFRSRRTSEGVRYGLSFGKYERAGCLAILSDCISMLYDKDFCLTNFDKSIYTDIFIDTYLGIFGINKDELMGVINKSIGV